MKTYQLHLDAELLKQIKVAAAKSGKTMKQLITDAIKARLKQE